MNDRVVNMNGWEVETESGETRGKGLSGEEARKLARQLADSTREIHYVVDDEGYHEQVEPR